MATTYLGSGDASKHRQDYRPEWLDNLADDVTIEGSVLTGIAEGPEAIRAILGHARTLYEYQEFNFVGPYGDDGFVEDYTSLVRGQPIGSVVVVRFNAAGQTARIVVNHRPLGSVLLWSQLMGEHFAGTRYAKYFLGKENTMPDPLIAALLGQDPQALTDDVSLATPLTSSRIIGRDAVLTALGAYATVIGATDADFRLIGEELDGAVFTTTVDGHTAQVAALVTRDAAGRIATIDMYGRPWPYMALVRDRLAELDPNLADPEIGTSPPAGPGTSWTEPPAIPPLADDVTLYSPVLTGNPTGKAVVGAIFTAALQSLGDPRFRAVLRIEGDPGFAAVMDATVNGNVSQIIQMFTLNAHGEVAEMRIFTRPWPVTADLRDGIHEHLGDLLGPEYWGGPQSVRS